ncbi:MAG: hypothetical protein LBC68_03155 [Prevotellaceae bacterium]|nr:hypothetical protein [Prevotellaceae bacterium]
MLVKTGTIYMSRGAMAVFQVSDNNPREWLGCYCVSTNKLFRTVISKFITISYDKFGFLRSDYIDIYDRNQLK